MRIARAAPARRTAKNQGALSLPRPGAASRTRGPLSPAIRDTVGAKGTERQALTARPRQRGQELVAADDRRLPGEDVLDERRVGGRIPVSAEVF